MHIEIITHYPDYKTVAGNYVPLGLCLLCGKILNDIFREILLHVARFQTQISAVEIPYFISVKQFN